MLILICLAASSILLGACNPPAAAPAQGIVVAGELSRHGADITLEQDGQVLGRWPVADPRPYQIVSLGPPVLVTTIDDQLQMTTWALGPAPRRYPGMYPAVARPTLTALAALPSPAEALALATRLLGADGQAIWSADHALLLLPAASSGDQRTAYCAQAGPVDGETDLVLPFGERPRLLAVDGGSGELQWDTDLDAAAAVADVQLTALAETHGLLTLQYNFFHYELLVFDRETGAITARHRLAGMPGTRVVYPGGFDELAQLELTGGVVSLAVYLESGVAQLWRISLADGGLTVTDYTPGRAAREENDLPAGGAGTPGPGAAVYPQKILPVASGADWRIPALLNSAGEVLVIDGELAGWLPAAPDGADSAGAG